MKPNVPKEFAVGVLLEDAQNQMSFKSLQAVLVTDSDMVYMGAAS